MLYINYISIKKREKHSVWVGVWGQGGLSQSFLNTEVCCMCGTPQGCWVGETALSKGPAPTRRSLGLQQGSSPAGNPAPALGQSLVVPGAAATRERKNTAHAQTRREAPSSGPGLASSSALTALPSHLCLFGPAVSPRPLRAGAGAGSDCARRAWAGAGGKGKRRVRTACVRVRPWQGWECPLRLSQPLGPLRRGVSGTGSSCSSGVPLIVEMFSPSPFVRSGPLRSCLSFPRPHRGILRPLACPLAPDKSQLPYPPFR